MAKLHSVDNTGLFKLAARLFFATSQPYLRFLGQWMREGATHDGRDEFFIVV